jgi:hypothetical protein
MRCIMFFQNICNNLLVIMLEKIMLEMLEKIMLIMLEKI